MTTPAIRIAVTAFTLSVGMLPLFSSPLAMENEHLRVSYDSGSQTVSITSKDSNTEFLREGRLAVKGDARLDREINPTYGNCQAIAVTQPDGQSAHILLPPQLPFALVYQTLTNRESNERILGKVPLLDFSPALGKPLTALRIRGTGGLSAADHPGTGSYEWLALADPETGAGIVAGWITQFKATGVLVPDVAGESLTIRIHSDYGHLRLLPGASVRSEILAVGHFRDVRLGLESWADQLARVYQVKLPPQPAGYCTWYAEKHGKACDEKNLANLGDFISRNLEPFGMGFVQIDDGWQSGDSKGNGPHKNFTACNPKGPYPSGIQATAARLASDKLTCGLWFMPFAGTWNDDWFKDKQGLFVKTTGGKPYDTKWGGTCLDMTNPAARSYVRNEVQWIKQQGVRYVKMDGFWTGLGAPLAYVNDAYKADGCGDAVFSDPSKSNVEVLREGMNLVREAGGPGMFYLGCCVAQNMRSYGGSFGLLDAMRIGPDNNGSFKGAASSVRFGSRNYFLNRRLWYCDPDPTYVRSSLSLEEARFLASWTSISGQLYTNSDWIPDLPPERLDILKRTVLPHGKTVRPLDFLDHDSCRVWQVIDDKTATRRDVVGLFNETDLPLDIDVPISKLQWPPANEFAVFDFWGDKFLPTATDKLTATLPPHSCQILAVRPMQDHPFVLSTSRHVTQGMVDLSDETWNPSNHTLQGKSQIVAGDPYQLRIAAPPGWKPVQASVDQPDAAIATSTDHGIRATITSPKGGVIEWRVAFTR